MALAAGLSLALAVRALGPSLTDPAAWLPGVWSHPDTLSNHWLLAWVAEQLAGGGSVVHNDRYYWPVGDAPFLAGNGAEGILYAPFHAVLGWPEAVPRYLLLVLFLNGMSGWCVGRAAGAGPWASLASLSVFAASPYVFQHLAAGRFSQASVCWLVFFVAAWLRLLARPTPRWGLLAGLLWTATSLFYWYYAWFGILVAAILLAARGLRVLRAPGVWVAAGVALALAGPWLGFHLSHWSEIVGTAEGVFPHPESRLDVATVSLAPWLEQGREAGRAVPLATWIAGLCGLGVGLRRFGPTPTPDGPPRWIVAGLLACWLVFAALALGPVSSGAPFSVLYGAAGVLRRFWWPLRHTVVLHVVTAALAGWALTALGDTLRRRALHRPELVVVGAALLLAAAAPAWLAHRSLPDRVPLSRMGEPDAAYRALAEQEPGVLVEPPLSPRVAGTQQHLLYQRTHGMPLLSGHALWVDRVRPPAWDAYVASEPLLAQLQAMEEGRLEGGLLHVDPAAMEALVDQGVRWFAVNREAFPFALRSTAVAYEAAFEGLFGSPVLRGRRLKIWDAARYTGALQVDVPVTNWPDDLPVPPAGQPLLAPRPPSALFPDALATP